MEMDQLVEEAGFEKHKMLIDDKGIFTVSIANERANMNDSSVLADYLFLMNANGISQVYQAAVHSNILPVLAQHNKINA